MSSLSERIKKAIRPGRLLRIAVAGSVAAAGLLLTAEAAGASWLQQDTPPVPSASIWEFTAVSCVGPNVCMAVGDASENTSQLLSETRSKSGWTIRSVPEPTPGSGLNSVWCTSASNCIAVGEARQGITTFVPLSERWNGNSWKILTTPTPAGTTGSRLGGVTCISPRVCEAVGTAFKGSRDVTLAERWNGSFWRVQPTPSRSGFKENVLNGLSCTAADRCIAVGDSANPPTRDVMLAERWNGSKWTLQTTPNPSSFTPLNAVSCMSDNDCMAVGNGIGARWNGKKWSALKLGFPGTPADLTSVSCTRVGACYADGGYYAGGVLQAVAEFWTGSRWKVQDTSTAITTSFDSSLLSGISCTTATNCTAVGSYDDPVNGNRALALDFAIRWQNQSPQPFFGSTGTGINGISCGSPSICLTVGTTGTATGFDAFSQMWVSGTWINEPVPKQAFTTLESVSCAATNACTAVGEILKGGRAVPLAERWNGLAWTIQGPPNPTGATDSFFSSVSCPAKNACTAVGSTSRNGRQLTLAEHWNGKSWRLQRTPNPARMSGLELDGVSCVSVSSCQTVGNSNTGVFAEAWNGSTWKLKGLPLPKGGRDGFFEGVSCTSARACISVGDYVDKSRQLPLAENWNGSRWLPHAAAAPGGGTIGIGLLSVSCVSATSCSAVGFVARTATNAIAERWNGRTWAMQPIDQPLGSERSSLSSVSCNSVVACMAVGNYTDSTATEQMLAEQYS